MGPYLPEEITGLFGGVSPHTLSCIEDEYKSGRPQWREIGFFPELAGCVKSEIPESLVKCAAGSAGRIALNILSTDDDSNIRALLWHMLTDAGHTVDFAKDGEEVFKRLDAKKYDLVILDVNMPKMNGYKVSELLHEKLAEPPRVIIFTGRDLEKERLQFVCSGADAILSKGTDNDELIQTIEGLFAKKPEKTAQAEEMFTPEPPPPNIEDFSVVARPIKLQREEFYAAGAEQEKAAPPPPPAALRRMAEIEAVKPGAVVPKTGEKALPAAQYPAPGRKKNGRLHAIFNQLILENKALKSDLVDIRRLLGHIELEYTQLEGQFEKQALKILDRNQGVSQKLEADWKNLRSYVTLVILLLLVAVLAAVLLM